ncbi:MAG: TIGR03435 family protein [Acidobacteriaceae bacterium]
MTLKPGPALNFSCKSLLLAAASIALACPMLFAQTTPAPAAGSLPPSTVAATPTPSFDVATIKLSPPEGNQLWIGIRNNPDGVEGAFVTIPMLIQRAYGLRSADQVTGIPAWAKDLHFDIQAKMSEADIAEMRKLGPAESTARRQLMLQSLLAERFKLKVHSETKQVPIFELVVAKSGPKLKDAAPDSSGLFGKGVDGKPLAGFEQATRSTMVAQSESMKALADLLSQPTSGLGRPVIDKTGLNGAYNFTLTWVPHYDRISPGTGGGSASPEDAIPLFEALQQLGLKLQPSNGPIDTIVIDHVEHPTAN